MKHHRSTILLHGETEVLDHITCDICGTVTQVESYKHPSYVVHIPEVKKEYKPTIFDMVLGWLWLIAVFTKAGELW